MFEANVNRYLGDKYNKGFRCWSQLLAMIYAQVIGSRSLRELEAGFNSQAAALYHLGCDVVKRSTLADANARRDINIFADTCHQLIALVKGSLKKELGDLLYLLDSTPISLKGLGYEWTQSNHRTQGLKVHMLLNPKEALPVYTSITAANVNDIDMGRQLPIEARATYVFDKGYCDYNWWYQIDQQNAFFVTRFKSNAGIQMKTAKPLTEADLESGVLGDSLVEFKHRRPGGQRVNAYCGTPLRRIVVARPDKQSNLVIATNDTSRPASEIALLYKQRWGIELFFKWLKQNLKIKQFLGRSENAVHIQIYTALITYLLVYLSHRKAQSSLSLKLWMVELKTGLFQRPETAQRTVRRRRQDRDDLHQIPGCLAL